MLIGSRPLLSESLLSLDNVEANRSPASSESVTRIASDDDSYRDDSNQSKCSDVESEEEAPQSKGKKAHAESKASVARITQSLVKWSGEVSVRST